MTRTITSKSPPAHDFNQHLASCGLGPLRRRTATTMQVNVGKRCNQACHHCHVEAGPKRTEIMDSRTAERCLKLLESSPGITLLDITGGAPEMSPQFRRLVTRGRELGREVCVRSNLTILVEPGFEDLIDFLAGQSVRVVASLPCYTAGNVDSQRGAGVFSSSMTALRLLNKAGFGVEGTGLQLNLVYNPLGAFLPPPQSQLEQAYRKELAENFDVTFNELFTITNMPIKRFADMLRQQGQTETYMSLLVDSFNPSAAPNVMCRDLVSISFDGTLFDCDFNQMLDMSLGTPNESPPRTIWDIENLEALSELSVATGPHCFGCTAGAGSSCGGSLT